MPGESTAFPAASIGWSNNMRATAFLLREKRHINSLALTVRFLQPDLGMKEPEILSRATAYLLSVDAKEVKEEGPHSHLKESELRRKERKYKQLRGRSSAVGEDRRMLDLSWLEFVPREVRPNVHVVCSSHVLSPFLWRDYYPQPWLDHVRQEHCSYALEVFNPTSSSQTPLGKYALHPEPLHHPEGKDIALMHVIDEKEALRDMAELGVQVLHLRNPDDLFEKGEGVNFDGFVIDETGTIDEKKSENEKDEAYTEESRAFQCYTETGSLSFHTEDRFFATTPTPLPGGMCGAPALDKKGSVCGTVEGIVPVDNKNKNLAGSAAFIPSFAMQAFIDFVERGLVEKMMPRDLFQMVQTAKKTNSVGGGIFRKDPEGNYTIDTTFEAEYDKAIARLKEKYTIDEYDEMMKSITQERTEVMEIMDKEGGDLDEIIDRVRHKRLQLRTLVRDQVSKQ